jgi:hypothetical protein
MTRQVTSPDSLPYYQASDTPDGAAQQQDLANTMQTVITNTRSRLDRAWAQVAPNTTTLLTASDQTFCAIGAVAPLGTGTTFEVTAHICFLNSNSGAARSVYSAFLINGVPDGQGQVTHVLAWDAGVNTAEQQTRTVRFRISATAGAITSLGWRARATAASAVAVTSASIHVRELS